MNNRYDIVGICGSRCFPDLNLVDVYLRALQTEPVVISGAAPGVDSYAVRRARHYRMQYAELPIHPFEWKQVGAVAGHLRNARIAQYLKQMRGRLVIFGHFDDDGFTTSGSKNMVDEALRLGIATEVFNQEGHRMNHLTLKGRKHDGCKQ